MKIRLIGVPTNSTGKKDGVARAPQALRREGLVDALARHCDVYDVGDVEFLEPEPKRQNGIIAYDSLVSMVYSVRNSVKDALEKNWFPLVVGGDCPILLGCLAATREVHHNYGLFFVDGHEDAYPPDVSPTGEAADMELGLALGMNTDGLSSELASLLPLVEKKNICLLGPRDKKTIQDYKIESLIKQITSYDDVSIQNQNVDVLIKNQIAKMRTLVNHWWLHVDFDVLDSDSMPAVDYPQPGGLSWNTLESLTVPLLSDACVGLNVTIYNPDLDPTAKHARQIIRYLENVVSSAEKFSSGI
ncbi:arginase family protein [Candidatus Parcubacteria bacterium]|nr:MAG: arginase family protein [Candidatus Parcubacteria bacterium]